jgi:hypothetical protein
MKKYTFTYHALFEMKRRGLIKEVVAKVIENPEQQWEIREGRIVLQSRVPMDVPERLFLVRVFVDIDRRPPEIVTAYRTRKIEKYWRKEQ